MHFRIKQALVEYLRRNWFIYLLITAFFAAGIVFGALAVKNLNVTQTGELAGYLNTFLEKVGEMPLNHQSFKQSFIENLYILGAVYLLGLTVIGMPLIPVVVFTRGFVIGFTIGFLAREKALRGILFACISVIPQNFILIPVIIVAAALSVNVSIYIIRHRLDGRGSLARLTGMYTTLMVVLGIITGLAGLCETYVTPVFIKMAAGYLL